MRKIEFKLGFIIPLLILPFYFKPFYVMYNNLSEINSIYVNAIRVIFIIVLFKYISQKRISKFILFLILFYAIKGIATILNSGDISSVITEAYPIIGICMFIELHLNKNPKQLIRAFSYVLTTLTVISCITILIRPEGYADVYSKIYFQRPGNQMSSFCILSMFFSSIHAYIKKDKKTTIFTWILLAINTYIIVRVNSTSGLIAWIAFNIYFIIPNMKIINKIISFKNGVYLYVVFFFSVIVFKIQDKLAFLIENLLGKNLTFTGRTNLWDTALMMISKKPLFGYGMSDNTNIIYSAEQGKFLSGHNQFIQLLLEGGIVSLVFFLIIIYLVYLQLRKYKENTISILIVFTTLSIGLVLFSEAMGFFDIIIILCVGFNANKIKQKYA